MVTKIWMDHYGIGKARGGSWARPCINPWEMYFLNRELTPARNAYFVCHLPGHFAVQCPLR
jgi:hypothetical protein